MSKPSKRLKLVVKHGEITAIYDDALVALMQDAKVRTKRASHVEPHEDGCGWFADLTPVGGPIMRRFSTRKAALDAEVAYLNDHVLT